MRTILAVLIACGAAFAQYYPPGGGGRSSFTQLSGDAISGATGGATTINFAAVTTLPAASAAVVGRPYRMTAATTANKCPTAGDSGGTALAYCVSNGTTYTALIVAPGATGNTSIAGTLTVGNTVTDPTAGITTITAALPVSSHGVKTSGAGLQTAQTAADVAAEFTGSCPSGATCALASNGAQVVVSPFPFSYQHGSFLGVGFGGATASSLAYPGADSFAISAACAGAGTSALWFAPISGVLTNPTITTAATNSNDFIRAGVSPGCYVISSSAFPQGGIVVPPLASAGGYVDTSVTDWWPLSQYTPLGMGFIRMGSATAAAVATVGAQFISSDGTTDSILSYSQAQALTASSTQYIGFGSYVNSTELNVAVPIAAAGTLQTLAFPMSTSPANNAVVTVNKNGSNTAITATIVAGDTTVGNYIDNTHTTSVAAGDYVDLQTVTGSGAVPTLTTAELLFIPNDGQTALLWGAWQSNTVSTTVNYGVAFGSSTSATEANVEYTFPFACTASHLYSVQAGANGAGVTTTITVRRGAGSTGAMADTIITGTITSGSGTGSIAIDTTHTVAFAQGDRFSISRVTASGTSGVMGGWGLACK
jgi:hypothetical protein